MKKKTHHVTMSPTAYAVLKAEALHERRSVNIWLDLHLEANFPTVWAEAVASLEAEQERK
jgi:hypothetical protein